jgi:hypothetical protein
MRFSRTVDADPPADPEAVDVVAPSAVVAAIDDALARFSARSLVSTAEVVDVLLDLRRLAAFDDLVAGATVLSAS